MLTTTEHSPTTSPSPHSCIAGAGHHKHMGWAHPTTWMQAWCAAAVPCIPLHHPVAHVWIPEFLACTSGFALKKKTKRKKEKKNGSRAPCCALTTAMAPLAFTTSTFVFAFPCLSMEYFSLNKQTWICVSSGYTFYSYPFHSTVISVLSDVCNSY